MDSLIKTVIGIITTIHYAVLASYVYQNNKNHCWELCDRNGNFIDMFFSKKSAQEAARSRNIEDNVVYESEIKNFRANMIKNGYADINGKR